jgi:salicylate hydroxylase
MEPYKNNFIIPQTSYSLNILIIGAGIAGLTSAIGLSLSGHHVRIYEQASQITEVGAGIQIAPNAARILRRFGLLDRVMEKANVLERNSLRRWEDGRELGVVEFGDKVCFSFYI